MGVPALFRWLSKKYPKIILPVAEEEEVVVKDDEGNDVSIPVNIAGRNPNGEEFDSLYLDMNGIVHPCTHPEGKPAPETEEEMMVEVFNYTERVVNMVRPRKLLFMAIDGVAPRAKMNQQRSRRFRSSREAKEKEEARQESLLLWESMGKTVTDEERNKKSWDSNAITPGTPFMTLLANSLRYWVAQKLNTDPGWKQLEVIISDASVPGEGEHKIMDFIRRQRTNPKHDPNTKHVIYGLDADLIMLALATHEPHFRVLREDVFFQANSNACRICGQEGHYAAQCTGTPAEIKKPPPEKKPFIFLDVAILREYLEIELRTPNIPFPFDLERAIDDWVLLIFFVGNDFLPHLPSLEIREGAIDTLLKIWKDELPRMGGYVTNHGQLELAKAQIILDGLAKREDDIFRRRREAEERQDQNAKRRKIERDRDAAANGVKASPAINLTAAPTAPSSIPSAHPSLPARPVTNNFAAKADSIGLGGPKSVEALQNAPTAVQALAGSNRDVVANRRAIRMANMSAAEVLKAELPGLRPVKPSASNLKSAPTPVTQTPASEDFTPAIETPVIQDNGISTLNPEVLESTTSIEYTMDLDTSNEQSSPHGTKRSIEEVDEDDDEGLGTDEDDAPSDPDKSTPYALKVNPDGTVEQDDTVRLWEPGYKERYYQQKFGVEYSDEAFKKNVVTKYVEGMAWVLQYYYQGTPSWQWYYPYHFAPFAADFTDIYLLDLKFELGQPFKPFEQLMGVFPAASRIHIPEVFHSLMTDKDSPIIDFYPSTFEIDMNGKRMAWQGVALLPFIDQKRLLEAMAPLYPQISDDENRRNTWGNNFLCVFEEHPLYATMVALYGKRRSNDPVPIDAKVNNGIAGSLLPDPECLPGSTYYCPMETVGLPNIEHDRSLSAFYLFPEQASPHRSVLLPGVRRPKPVLTEEDREFARRGGRGRGGGYSGQDRGGRGSYGNNGRDYANRGDWQRGQAQSNYSGNYGQRSYNNNNSQLAYGSYQQSNYQQPSNYRGGYNSRPPTEQSYDNYGGYGGGGYSGPSGRGAGPPRGGAPSRGGVQGYGGGGGYGTSYNQQYSQQSYGGYRGGSGGRGGYTNNGGGYGGNYGGQQSNYGGYGGGNSYNSTPRGGYGNGQSRGRGRGGGGRY